MALLLPLAPCPVRITLVLLRAAAPPLSAAGARGPLSLDTSHWIPLTVGLLLPASSHSLLLTTPLTASRFPLTPQVPEDPSDAATAAAVAFRKRTRTGRPARPDPQRREGPLRSRPRISSHASGSCGATANDALRGGYSGHRHTPSLYNVWVLVRKEGDLGLCCSRLGVCPARPVLGMPSAPAGE